MSGEEDVEAVMSDVRAQLDNVESSIQTLEETLQPILSLPLAQRKASLPSPLERARLELVLAYTSNALFFMHLATTGITPQQHPVKAELDRIQSYMKKLRAAEQAATGGSADEQGRALRVDKAAAGRFVKHALEGDDGEKKDKTKKKKKKEKREREEDDDDEEDGEKESTPAKKKKSKKSKKTEKTKGDIKSVPAADLFQVDTVGAKKSKKDKKNKSEPIVDDKAAKKAAKAEKKRKRDADEEVQENAPKEKAKKSKKKEDLAATADDAAKWNVDDLEGGDARQAKFMRLLGAKKAGAMTNAAGKSKNKEKSNSSKAEAEIQRQFEDGMKMKFEGVSQRRGLGA